MALPCTVQTLIAALMVIAKAHLLHPVVPALYERIDDARKEQRRRRNAARGVSRKTLYTYVANLSAFLVKASGNQAQDVDCAEIAQAFIAAEPRSAHRYFASLPSYQFHAMVQFIAERNLADARALGGGRKVSGLDELYYQLYDFIGAEPPQAIADIRGYYYAYRPSLSALPKILKSLVQIERKPSGAVGYLERMEFNTKQDGSRRQILEGYVLSMAREVFVITRDSNTGLIQTSYLDIELRDAQVRENTRIMRMNGRYNGITFNATQARIFSSGILLEAANDPASRAKNLWEDSILDQAGIGLNHPDDLPDAIVTRLERHGYQRPKAKREPSRPSKK